MGINMHKNVIFYLHGFNSASLDVKGRLLIRKDKLRVLQAFCADNDLLLLAPNVDYRDFEALIEDALFAWNHYLDQGCEVVFMGSSMGGFASEYLAMKTGAKAIMINPVIRPSELLLRFIGVEANYETGEPYDWLPSHCDQYVDHERRLADNLRAIDRTVLLDCDDELLDAEQTRLKYQTIARVVSFDGGSHAFEHMQQALPVIESVILGPRR
jgi:uncharacterized protein